MVINALDLTLSCHIQSSSISDPFVLKALTALDEGSPLFTRATLLDWSFDNGHHYFRKRLYVPPSVMILFPYRSILLIVHSRRLLTWRGRGSVTFLNTTYLLVHSSSTFSLVNLSLDVLIS